MSKEQYLMMCEQTGEEIDWDKCPPEIEDFPQSVVTALNIYNSMGNRMYPDIGYIGKDFTNINMLLKLYDVVHTVQIDWTLEILLYLDRRAIQESQKQIKAEMAKIKKK
tara:strand:- start:435 stop:761 length:327 start_codon:yes stop_codon:yes gene_type:complete